MRRLLILGTILVVFIFGSLFVYKYYFQNRTNNPKNNGDSNSVVKKDNFEFEYNYVGNSLWSYSIVGYFPTPCYTSKVDELVSESYPEMVSIILTVTAPNLDTACVDVISQYSHEGTFNASEKAKVDFSVINN